MNMFWGPLFSPAIYCHYDSFCFYSARFLAHKKASQINSGILHNSSDREILTWLYRLGLDFGTFNENEVSFTSFAEYINSITGSGKWHEYPLEDFLCQKDRKYYYRFRRKAIGGKYQRQAHHKAKIETEKSIAHREWREKNQFNQDRIKYTNMKSWKKYLKQRNNRKHRLLEKDFFYRLSCGFDDTLSNNSYKNCEDPWSWD